MPALRRTFRGHRELSRIVSDGLPPEPRRGARPRPALGKDARRGLGSKTRLAGGGLPGSESGAERHYQMGATVALIVAAGRGHRLGAPLPKQYLPLAGRAVLCHSVAAFAALDEIAAVRVAIHPDDRRLYDEALAPLPSGQRRKLMEPVPGGAERQDSVLNGLESLAESPPGAVLIHDAARPLISPAVIRRTLAALSQYPGAIAALPVSDTLKRTKEDAAQPPLCGATVERSGLWRAQTPQTFRFEAILDAHRHTRGQALTDDAAVAEAAGLAVALVMGSEDNLKVTTPDDLDRALRLIEARLPETRVGMGFDVHAFGPGDSVMLCGVRVPHARGVVGHSDADVGLHALTDAILGALGAGDIGAHFPPSDEKWRNADSALFLRHAASLVAQAGGTIGHVDLTILAEAPKVGPHRARMTARIAEILSLTPGRVSLKATTTEGLGFLGRGEGIAAQAVATLRLPPGVP